MSIANFIRGYHNGKAQYLPANLSRNTILDSWWTGGDSGIALNWMSSQRAPIVQTSCTQERQQFEATDGLFPMAFVLELNFKAFREEIERNGPRSADDFIRQNVADPKVRDLLKWMVEPLNKAKSFNEFTQLAFFPPRCEQTARTRTPRFEVKSEIVKTSQDLESKIDSILQKNRLVGLNICAAVFDRSIEDCGSHATAVAGWRVICDSHQKCEKEYLFLDSSFFPRQAKNQDGSMWVAASQVLESALEGADHIDNSTAKMDTFIREYHHSIKTLIDDYNQTHEQQMAELRLQLERLDQIYQQSRTEIIRNIESHPQLSKEQRRRLISETDQRLNRDKRVARQNLVSIIERAERDSAQAQASIIGSMGQFEKVVAGILNFQSNIYWIDTEAPPSDRRPRR